ncbi:MAG: methyltransferase [Gaiellaceae bacterium]
MTEQEAKTPRIEPGSFRDPDSRVFISGGRILRLLSEQGLADWKMLSSSPLFAELVAEGKLVGTREAGDLPDLPDALHGGVAAVLEHDVIPFVSYPYEWTFSMLRDAALLQLELVERAIGAGMMLKDSTPYNVQFVGARPVFVDVGSFEKLRGGEPWAGYRQFCMLFLFPLLLVAWKDIPFQPWLRGSIAGISPQDCRKLLSNRDLLRRGALTHIALHSRLEQRYEETDADMTKELKTSGFNEELILANIKRLRRLISKLEWKPEGSEWSGYELTTTYSDKDAERKAQFVTEVVQSDKPDLVWDLGCNEGHHARIAAKTARYVVAVDTDALVVDRLYGALGNEGQAKILPLTMDLADPSPGLGWRGLERKPLPDRGSPDLALCLALIHHVSISGNVPVAEFLDWLQGMKTALVIEFPTPEDPMVRRLLRRKRAGDHPDYNRDWFEQSLARRFDVVRSEVLSSGERVLYHARPRA